MHSYEAGAATNAAPAPISPSLSASPGLSSLSNFPKNAKLINLRDGTKVPTSLHGHKDAVPQGEFVQTGTNVGIVLDGMFLLVDIDHEENDEARALSARVLEAAPRVHKTPRGRHFLFRTQPEWSGNNNKLRDKNGNVYGDIKALGYAVGPGSKVDGTLYSVIHDVEPPLAPQWLLDMATKPARAETALEERSGIPNGEHDHYFTSLAGFLRGRWGLTEKAILGVLAGGPQMALEDIDENRPYTERDFQRIAHSVARHAAKNTSELGGADTLSPGVRSAQSIELVGPPIQWVVRGFIPRGELVLMYGPGGIGKSSMGSWLAAEANRLRLTFAYMGTEEPPSRFFGRAILAGARRDECFDILNPAKLKFPRDAETLRAMILESKIDFLYIDSIYTHFERNEGDNAAERARDALAPLLAIAHDTGCTIFGVFHTNKSGAFLGSTEMENVTRVLLEAKRKSSQTYLGIKVHKTNLYNPGKLMRLEGKEEIFRDEAGNSQLEVLDTGEVVPLKIMVPKRIPDVDDVPEENEMDGEDAPMEFNSDSIRPAKVPTSLAPEEQRSPIQNIN